MHRNVKKIANEIVNTWDGPSGQCWCDELKKFVDPEETDCVECEPIDQSNDHPPKYLRPKDISW